MSVTLKKTSSTLNENYNVENEKVMGTVTTVSNQETKKLIRMDGQVYGKKEDGTQGVYIGNFNGMLKDGAMKYTTSQMTRAEYNIVMDLTEELEKELVK